MFSIFPIFVTSSNMLRVSSLSSSKPLMKYWMEQNHEWISKPITSYFTLSSVLQPIKDLFKFIANIFHVRLWIYLPPCPVLTCMDSLPGHWPVGGLTNKWHHLKLISEDWNEVIPVCHLAIVWLCSSTKHHSSCQSFREELCLLSATSPSLHLFRYRVITIFHCF